jgi:hypothetical protein
MNDWLQLTVGKPFPTDLTSTPTDGNLIYLMPSGGLLIAMFLDNPTAAETDSIQHGRFQMRFLKDTHTIMFLMKFGDTAWQEAPFSVHRLASEERIVPTDPGEGMTWLATIVIVDSSTGLVGGIRETGMSRRFCLQISEALTEQIARPADDQRHQEQVARFQRSETKDLAMRATAKFIQGETAN